jgi:hypothetical protein
MKLWCFRVENNIELKKTGKNQKRDKDQREVTTNTIDGNFFN